VDATFSAYGENLENTLKLLLQSKSVNLQLDESAKAKRQFVGCSTKLLKHEPQKVLA